MSGGKNLHAVEVTEAGPPPLALVEATTRADGARPHGGRFVNSLLRATDAEPVTLTPLERLERLCDPGSLRLVRTGVVNRRLGERARPGDGVLAGTGCVDGRTVFCYAQDAAVLGGSLGAAHADTIVRVMELALAARAPVIGFVESAGARMQEGTLALGGYGRVFRANVALSGRVPQITVITGCAAGGGVYSPALTDVVVMTRKATMFLTGPGVVREVTGEDVDGAGLGGPRVHDRNGVAQMVVEDDIAACAAVRRVLGYLPQCSEDDLPSVAPQPPEDGDPGAVLPPATFNVYDVRDVARRLVDRGSFLELSPRWARNMVTAFARLDGQPVGVIANQPRYLGGVIDAVASEKGARFVRMCNCFGLPLVVLVDTPGFMPGTKQESAGIIRRGAKLLYAFIEAQVPKVSIVLRQGYGGGFITMNCKDIGADYALAWPDASIGVMGARQAVRIIHRRDIAAAADPEAELAARTAQYVAEYQGAEVSAQDGVIDELVEPAETREVLVTTLSSLRGKRRSPDCPGNMPL